jgi:RNA polymerase sigma factor (sigma-70 family)
MSDSLQEYVRTGSSEAFGRIVRAYSDAVYSQSLRQLRDPALAEEVTQQVFVTLASKAGKISNNVVLAGWLFNTTRYRCARERRAEYRRHKHEQQAMRMRQQTERGPSESDLQTDAEPLLNNAIAGLRGRDRDAILLKYFHGHTMREVGTALGVSEDAAKQRVSRAVEKLRTWFARQGLAVPSTTMTLMLSSAVKPAPSHLVATMAAAHLPKSAGVIWSWMNSKLAASVVLGTMTVAAATVGVKGITHAASAPAAPPIVLADAGEPAMRPVTVGSQATPIDTLRKLSAALHQDDRPAVDACLTDDGTDPDMAALVRAHFHEMGAWSHVLAAARKSFNRDDIPLKTVGFTMFPAMDGGYETMIDKMLEKDPEDLKIDGDTALVRVNNVPRELLGGTGLNRKRHTERWSGATLFFRKVDGDWKLDTSRSINIVLQTQLRNNNADPVKVSAQLCNSIADAMAEGAAQIESGQLATIAAAGAAIERTAVDAFRACGANMMSTNSLPVVGG